MLSRLDLALCNLHCALRRFWSLPTALPKPLPTTTRWHYPCGITLLFNNNARDYALRNAERFRELLKR